MELYEFPPPFGFHKLVDDGIGWDRVSKKIRGDGLWKQR